MNSNLEKPSDDEQEKEPGLWSPALLVMYIDTFMIAVGFFMFVPILGYYFINELGWSAALSGTVLAISGLAQQGFKFLCGVFADRVGYKRAILIGLATRVVGFIMYGVAFSPIGYAAAAFMSGLGGALFHPASYAAYARLTGTVNKSRIFAIREMLSNTGFIIGPVIGMFLLGYNFQTVSFTAAGLFALTLVMTWFLLPAMEGQTGGRESLLSVFGLIIRNRTFLMFNLLLMGVWALNTQLYLAVPVRAAAFLDDPAIIAYLYTAGAVFMVLFQLPVIRLLNERYPPASILACGTLVLGIGLFSLGFAVNAGLLLVSVILFMLGQMIAVPTMNSMVSGFADQRYFASYFGFSGLGLAIGGFLGNSGAGYLYDLSNKHSDQLLIAWLPWTVHLLLAAVLCAALFRMKTTNATNR